MLSVRGQGQCVDGQMGFDIATTTAGRTNPKLNSPRGPMDCGSDKNRGVKRKSWVSYTNTSTLLGAMYYANFNCLELCFPIVWFCRKKSFLEC